jgi:hypothetical protein
MAELETKAAKSRKKMDKEPTPKKHRMAVSRTERMEVDGGAQVQWQVDADEFKENVPRLEEENARGKRKGKAKAKSTRK